MKDDDLQIEIKRLKNELEALKREKAHFEKMIKSCDEHGTFVIQDIINELKTTKKEFLLKANKYAEEVAELHSQLESLRGEKEDLEMMMEMAADHADGVGEELLGQIQDSEKRFRLITETIPVPVLITLMPGAEIIYANESSVSLFGIPPKLLLKKKGTDFYNPSDRKRLLDIINKQGNLKNEELLGHDINGKPFWVELSIEPIVFDGKDCLLSVWHDITKRKKAEEEIQRLNEELSRQEKEKKKFVIFTLAGDKYGLEISCVKEIITMMPLNPVPNMQDALKGVINLRGRVYQIRDLRLKFGMEEADYTDRSCIIILELPEKKGGDSIGVIVDSVSEVLSIIGRNIKKSPTLGPEINTEFISGMAEVNGEILVLVDIEKLF